MKSFLKVLLVILIIAVIGLTVWIVKIYIGDNEQVNSVANSKTENNAILNENQIDDEQENIPEATKEEVEELEDEQEEEKNEQQESINEQTSISDEDKAIELAKKQYGSTDGVYFRIEQIQNNNIYIVSVRDENTTAALMWYTVNVKNEIVE